MPFHDFHIEEENPNSHHCSLWGSCLVESDGDDEFEFYYYGLTNTTNSSNHTVTYLKLQGFLVTS